MPTIVTEKRLYETPDGELVEELEDWGSLFCGVGAELTGEEASRYQAYVRGESKATGKSANKEASQAENKGASLTERTVAELTAQAEELGLQVGRRPRKDDLIEAIAKAGSS